MTDLTGDGINDLDITATGASVTVGGAIFGDAAKVGSGTGGYNTFLALGDNNDPNDYEIGLNTDDSNPLDPTNTEIDASKTHTVLLSGIPITIGTGTGPGGNGGVLGVAYYEFRVDLNESNNTPSTQISLDQFKIFTSSSSTIENVGQLGSPVYDMDAGGNISILLSEAGSSGSGTDDYAVLVPVSAFGNANPATTYMYLYVQMGAAGPAWITNGGFEEWNLQNAVTLTGIKFNDHNSNGTKDVGDENLAGYTMELYKDTNGNNQLDSGDQFISSTVTGVGGTYTFFGVGTGATYFVKENTTVGPVGVNFAVTTGAYETVTVAANATGGSSLTVANIGNHIFTPNIAIDKVFVNVTDGPDVSGGTTVINGAGDIANYTIAVTNNGELALVNVILTDALADGGTVTAVLSGGFNTGDLDHDNVLDVGETWNYTAHQTATQTDLDTNGGGDGDKDNTASVVATVQGASNTVSASDSAAAPIVPSAALAITKVFTGYSDGNGNSLGDAAGDIAHYTLAVSNTGNVTLTNVTVVDPLTGTNINVGTLAPGATQNLATSYTLTQGDLDSRGGGDNDIDNTATATSDQTGQASASAVAPLVDHPDLGIDKAFVGWTDGNGNAVGDAVGDHANYTITVTNNGNITLHNVVITDPLTNATYNVGTLAVGQTATVNEVYVLTQADLDGAGNAGIDYDIDNTATADSTETDPVSDTATAPELITPVMIIEKTMTGVTNADGSADADNKLDAPNDVAHYSIVVTNTGNTTLEGVVVTDDITGHSWTIATLSPGMVWSTSDVYSVTQAQLDALTADSSIVNIATATDDEAGVVSDDASVGVDYAPAMSIVKTMTGVTNADGSADADGKLDAPTDVAHYAIVVTNTGNVTLENVLVHDDITDNDWTIPTLAPGASVTLNDVYSVTQEQIDAGTAIHNVATAEDDEAGTVSDDADVGIQQTPTMAIVKTMTGVTNGDGSNDADNKIDATTDVAHYSILVTNTGNVTLTNVHVVDSITGHSWDIASLEPGASQTFTDSYSATQVQIDAGTDLPNIATATDDAAPAVSDDASVSIHQTPAVAIDKQFVNVTGGDGDALADAVGDVLNYKILVTNTGNVTLTNVLVTDPLTGLSTTVASIAPGA
ncbi:MAG: hypothetical protein ACKOPE_11085, partial [Novosphingobium sp.]